MKRNLAIFTLALLILPCQSSLAVWWVRYSIEWRTDSSDAIGVFEIADIRGVPGTVPWPLRQEIACKRLESLKGAVPESLVLSETYRDEKRPPFEALRQAFQSKHPVLMFLAPSCQDRNTPELGFWVDLTNPCAVYTDDCTELTSGKRILSLVKSQIAKRSGQVIRRGLWRYFGKERLPVFDRQTGWLLAALGLGAVIVVRLVARLIALCVPKLRWREARASRPPGGRPGLRWRFWSITQGLGFLLAACVLVVHLWCIRDDAIPDWHGSVYFVKSAAPEYKATIVRQLKRGEIDWSYYRFGTRTERAIYDLISYPGKETIDLIKPYLKDETWYYHEEFWGSATTGETGVRRTKLYPLRQTAYYALKLLGEDIEKAEGYAHGCLPSAFRIGLEYCGIFPSEGWTKERWEKLTGWPDPARFVPAKPVPPAGQ